MGMAYPGPNKYDDMSNESETGDLLKSLYTERANLIALLAKHYESGWSYSDPEYPLWPVIYILLPTGQASWHIHPDDFGPFSTVPYRPDIQWDGHTTEQKYQRILELIFIKSVTE